MVRPQDPVMEGVNQMTDLYFDIETDRLTDDPRTVVSTFPGNRDAAMGYALVAQETIEEADPSLDVEREYVAPVPDEFDVGGHIVAIHIEGGDDDVSPEEMFRQ